MEGQGEGENTKLLSNNDNNNQSSRPLGSQITVNEAVEYCGFGTFNLLTLASCSLSWAILALVVECVTFLIEHMKQDPDLEMTSHRIGIISAAYSAGCAVSAVPWGLTMDKFGRAQAVVVAIWLICSFLLLSCLMKDWEPVCYLRFCSGLVGPAIDQGPNTLYVETTPISHRGTTRVFLHGGWQLGSLACILLASAVPRGEWQLYLLMCSLVAFGIAIFVTPWLVQLRSPHFLNVTGENDKALQALNHMAKWNNKEPIQSKLEEIHESNHHDMHTLMGRLYDLFDGAVRTPLLVLLVSFCFLSGGWIVMWIFLADYMEFSGRGDLMHVTYTAIPVGKITSLFVAMTLVDRVGRIVMCSIGGISSSICVFMILWVDGAVPLWLTVFAFAVTVELCWIALYGFAAEFFPSTVRGTAVLLLAFVRSVAEVTMVYSASFISTSNPIMPVVASGCLLLVEGLLVLVLRAHDTTGIALVATAEALHKD